MKHDKKNILKRMKRYRGFYLMFIPVAVLTIIFYYVPMGGVLLAFTKYNGVKAPKFVGLKNFQKLFSMPGFWTAFGNTLFLSIVKLLLNTILAVVISVLLNELVFVKFKKAVQTIVFLPHFMSWVVTASIFALILSPTWSGLVNQVLIKLGLIKDPIYFLGSLKWWRPTFFMINIWKDTGWGTIIFLATLSGINPELYEAAAIDGAGRWGKMKYVTIPALTSTFVIVLVLNLASVMNLFEPVFVLENDAVTAKADVLQTYIYYQTFNSGSLPDYGYTTAIGLISSLVGMVLVLICNRISYKLRGRGIV